ncbi:hypothetical protein WN944_027925 [Citrus x changshan-huyou]|uniref:ATP synthase subunit d, mitochondrial n=1 Tax=Citrus x changshan-huyou TaxID=2935761 RepID=A0AAP0LMS4_9ROSI
MAKMLVSDEARKEFPTLRRAFDEVNSTLQTKFSQEPEPIDWEYYRKGIGSRLVDMHPKSVDNVTPQYKHTFDSLLVELKEAEEKSFKESERLEKEIAEVQEMKRKISTMTADEYVEKHPETSVLWMLICLRDSCAIRFMKSNCDNMLLDLDWKAGGGGTKKCGQLRV